MSIHSASVPLPPRLSSIRAVRLLLEAQQVGSTIISCFTTNDSKATPTRQREPHIAPRVCVCVCVCVGMTRQASSNQESGRLFPPSNYPRSALLSVPLSLLRDSSSCLCFRTRQAYHTLIPFRFICNSNNVGSGDHIVPSSACPVLPTLILPLYVRPYLICSLPVFGRRIKRGRKTVSSSLMP